MVYGFLHDCAFFLSNKKQRDGIIGTWDGANWAFTGGYVFLLQLLKLAYGWLRFTRNMYEPELEMNGRSLHH